MSNPFAPQLSTDATASNANTESPFAASANQGDLGAGFELPPCPVGILKGHTTELKTFKSGYRLEVKCDDPAYASCEPIGIWIGKDVGMLRQIAGALGITHQVGIDDATRKSRIYFTDDNGNQDAAAFKNKPGLFVFAPRNGEANINAFGLPKPGISPEWDQYVDELPEPFNDEQLKALKRSRGGVIPGDSIHLFE